MDLIKIIKEEYNKLGRGAFGSVYKKNGFAHKLTSDFEEAVLSQIIKDRQHKLSTFPKIYKIFSDKKMDKFVIIRELVQSLKKPTEIARIDANIYKIRSYVNTGNKI